VSKAQANELIYDVSIVVPIYNGEEYITTKLESLIAIQGVNYEVIIALNKSTDRSEEIIDFYSSKMQNLTLIKHSSFIEGGKNFQLGVKAARGHFIFVSAVDDICSKGFYSEALKILKENETVCAVSPMSRFEDNIHGNRPISFELSGNVEERVRTLFENIRVSHGIFYSLIRRDIATALYRDFFNDYSFIGGDWLFDLKLALEGEVLRSKSSECIFGVNGVSREKNYLPFIGTSSLKKIFPYSSLVGNIIKLSMGQKVSIKVLLLKISLGLLWGNLHRYISSLPYICKMREMIKER